jgi:tetratricopeptide (TPR) repeat protein/predicted aspartyl protease
MEWGLFRRSRLQGMKGRQGIFASLTILALCAPAAHAASTCKIAAKELPITMIGLRPTIRVKLNGVTETFLVDSGAFFSSMSEASAAALKLHVTPMDRYFIQGVNGKTPMSVTNVKDLLFDDIDLHKVDFVVGGTELSDDIAGIIGQNLLRILPDIEYDLAHGMIRFVKPDGCRDTEMVYWTHSQPYSVMDITWATAVEPHTTGTAYLNGAKIRVMFDTGAGTSYLTLDAAKRAGIKIDAPTVEPSGFTYGIGRERVRTWITTFQSFKIGDEEIKNARLRIGESSFGSTDMLLGPDFFLSHRIYVAGKQHKLYFTYNGGPVFDLRHSPAATPPNSTAAVPSSTTSDAPSSAIPGDLSAAPANAASPTAADKGADAENPSNAPEHLSEPTDAAGFSRRGTAFAARKDYEHAIPDLTRACELDPQEPRYFYQRGMAYWGNGHTDLATVDFDHALELKPDDVVTLVARAELRLGSKNDAGAIADLDVAQRAAPKEAGIRLAIADLYMHSGRFESAIAQYDLWIPIHDVDARKPEALADRCWARALLNQEVDKALSDCNRALSLRSDVPGFRGARALVQFRRAKFDKAVADWDVVVAKEPKNAWALYGRGIAKMKEGRVREGEADVKGAEALNPKIAEVGKRRDVVPP